MESKEPTPKTPLSPNNQTFKDYATSDYLTKGDEPNKEDEIQSSFTEQQLLVRADSDSNDVPSLILESRKHIIRSLIIKLTTALLVILFMVTSAILGQRIQTKYQYNKPYLITWFNTTFLMLLAVAHFSYLGTRQLLRRIVGRETLETNDDIKAEIPTTIEEEILIDNIQETKSITSFGVLSQWKLPNNFTFFKFYLMSILFATLWFSANYLFVMGLPLTTVTSSLSLEQMATVLVYILSAMILREKITVFKSLAVIICIGGVVTVSFADRNTSSNSISKSALVGDLLIILSTIATALYMVSYKKFLHNVDMLVVNSLLSMIGFNVALLFFPGIIICHFSGWEKFQMPASTTAIILIIVHAFTSLLFNVFLNWGMLIASPLFMRIAIICSIPTSFAIEILIFGNKFNILRLMGAILIIIGFIFFSVVDSFPSWKDMKATVDPIEDSIKEEKLKQ